MTARLFLDERNLKELGFTQPNILTLRELTKFLNVQNTVTEVVGPIQDLTTTGLLVRTGENLWTTRTIGATAGHIDVTNGDGVAGAPTLALPNSGATAGSYTLPAITVDAQGRVTAASSGSASSVLDGISSTRGAILYRGASGWSALTPGTSGQFLKTLGAGVDPAWATVSGGSSADHPTFTTPTDGSFAWINQGSASVTVNANGGIYLQAPKSSTISLRVRKMTAPATPYTVTIAVYLLATNAGSSQHGGIILRDSSSGKLINFGVDRESTFSGFVVQRNNSPTSFSASAKTVSSGQVAGLFWLRVNDDGTNRTFSSSFDGYNFITLYSEARTTFATTDEIGFYVSEQSNLFEVGMTLLSWAVT